MEGALRNEFEKNAASFIPEDIVTEFVFGKSATITVGVAQQPNLDALFEPADYPQVGESGYVFIMLGPSMVDLLVLLTHRKANLNLSCHLIPYLLRNVHITNSCSRVLEYYCRPCSLLWA